MSRCWLQEHCHNRLPRSPVTHIAPFNHADRGQPPPTGDADWFTERRDQGCIQLPRPTTAPAREAMIPELPTGQPNPRSRVVPTAQPRQTSIPSNVDLHGGLLRSPLRGANAGAHRAT